MNNPTEHQQFEDVWIEKCWSCKELVSDFTYNEGTSEIRCMNCEGNYEDMAIEARLDNRRALI